MGVFHPTLPKKPLAATMNKLVAALALGTAGAETFVEGGTLGLTWKDCGDASTKAKISGLTPTSLTLGQKTTVTGSGSMTEGVHDGNHGPPIRGLAGYHLRGRVRFFAPYWSFWLANLSFWLANFASDLLTTTGNVIDKFFSKC